MPLNILKIHHSCVFLNREKVSIYFRCSGPLESANNGVFCNSTHHSQSTQIAAIQTDCSLATFCLQM